MHVLVNGLQAGNRSGTGVYTQKLVEWLPRVADDLNLTVLWPEGLPAPQTAPRTAFIAQGGGGLARVLTDQYGLRGHRLRVGAELVHYPASVGSVFNYWPFVVTVHDLSFLAHPEWFRAGRAAYYRWAVSRSVLRATRIIADSEATARDLRECLSVSADRIDVIPLGVDETLRPASPEACAEVRRKYALPDRYLLFLGTLEPRKNLVRLVRAWSRVADRGVPDLVLAGRLGWKVEPILREIRNSPYATRIHLPGYIADEDMASVLTGVDAFVWPSLYEGFGLPPLEAMACGTPVLTSNTSSLPEAVGDAALTVDPEDEDAIAEAMLRLVDDRSLSAALRVAGPLRAAAFTWRRTAELTVESYRRALGR